MRDSSNLHRACRKLLGHIRDEINESSRGDGVLLEGDEVHRLIGVDRDLVSRCLDILQSAGLISGYKWAHRSQFLINNLSIRLPEHFLDRCRKILSLGRSAVFHRITLNKDTVSLFDEVTQSEIVSLEQMGKAYPVAEYLFVTRDDSRGEWISWDEVAEFIAGGGEYDVAQMKRRIYDIIISFNQKAVEAIGTKIIENDGQTLYRVMF